MVFLIGIAIILLGSSCFAKAVEYFINQRYWLCGFFIMQMTWLIICLVKIMMNV